MWDSCEWWKVFSGIFVIFSSNNKFCFIWGTEFFYYYLKRYNWLHICRHYDTVMFIFIHYHHLCWGTFPSWKTVHWIPLQRNPGRTSVTMSSFTNHCLDKCCWGGPKMWYGRKSSWINLVWCYTSGRVTLYVWELDIYILEQADMQWSFLVCIICVLDVDFIILYYCFFRFIFSLLKICWLFIRSIGN